MGVKCCCLSQDTIDRLNQEINRLTQLMKTHKTQHKIEQDLRTKMQNQIAALKIQANEGTTNLNEKIILQREKDTKINLLRAQNIQLNLTIQNFHTERDRSNNRIIETQNNIQSLRREISECPIQISYGDSCQELEQVKNQKLRQLLTLNMQCVELTNKREPAQKQCQNLTSRLRMLQNQVVQLNNKKQNLKRRIEEIKGNQYFIQLTILENQQIIKITVKGDKNISQLKQIIYQQYYSDLHPLLMAIIDDQYLLNEDQQIRYMFPIKRVKLGLRKAHVWEIPGFISYPDREDEIYGERGIVIMSCGHSFSRGFMRDLIAFQIENSYDENFHCNYKKSEDDDSICNSMLSTDECSLIGGYTAAEWDPIQTKLSEKYLKKYSKACPKCKISNSFVDVKTKRMQCNGCKINFCHQCGEVWNWKGDSICQSQICVTIRELIVNSPHQRLFQVYRRPNTDVRNIRINAPNTRACPSCKNLISNVINCKHTACPCGQSFCYICLSKCVNGRWSCGGAYQQCQLAPNQTQQDLIRE